MLKENPVFNFVTQENEKLENHSNMTITVAQGGRSFVTYPRGMENTHPNVRSRRTSVLLITVLAFLLLSALSIQAHAANWYVRPSGGSGSGMSWAAAWNGLGGINWASVAAGDTIWVAGGTYTQDLAPNKTGTAGNFISIRRARSDSPECTGAAGWSTGFDALVLQDNASIIFTTGRTLNYITISGRTTANGGDYGWKVWIHGGRSGNGVVFDNGSYTSQITLEYMELAGPNIQNYDNDSRGVDDTPGGGSASYHTFSHMKIWGWESGIYAAYGNYHVSEYIDMYNISSDGTMHPNLYYIISSDNGIIRFSRFHDSAASGTGIAFSDGGSFANWKIYGNVFYDMMDAYAASIGVQDAAIPGLLIYNNTFVNVYNNLNLSSASCGAGSETRNNLFYGSGGAFTCGTSTNNLQTATDPFVNLAGKDFRIKATIGSAYPRDKGISLGSSYNTDMLGTLRGGADGTWDIGAFEYTSGSEAGPPATPGSLQVR
jgi:hypothetical protein